MRQSELAPIADGAEVAARLCAACGMCCNGVLFSGMKVQPDDDLRQLAAFGLRAKRRKDGHILSQPCQAHTGTACRIYENRPHRCRAFDCRQIQRFRSSLETEAGVLEKIVEARALVERVRVLLYEAGETREHKALGVRLASVFTPPLDPSPHAEDLRTQLREAGAKLEQFLARHFRTETSKSGNG